MIKIIILFAILQTINVIFQTMKSLILAKSDNVHLSAIINAITFGFYVIVVKQIAELPIDITVALTIITNIIGVYITYAIMNAITKDKVWLITATLIHENKNFPYRDFIRSLKRFNIEYVSYDINEGTIFTLKSYSQAHSKLIKEVLDKYDIERTVIEVSKKL